MDELVFVRDLPAPVDLVFRCLTDPAHLARFWGPQGTSTAYDDILIELHPGGRFETTMVNDADGSSYRMRVRFDEIDPPFRLRWTDVDSGMITVTSLSAVDPYRTTVRIEQWNGPAAARSPAARAGFLTSLDRLERHLRRSTREDA